MKHRYFLLLTILLLTTVSVNAQRRTRSVVSESSQVVKDYLDSLNVMRKRLDSLQQVNNQLRQEQSDGRYFRLFAPTTFHPPRSIILVLRRHCRYSQEPMMNWLMPLTRR